MKNSGITFLTKLEAHNKTVMKGICMKGFEGVNCEKNIGT